MSNSTKVCKQALANQITELEARIAASPFTLEESRKASELVSEVLNNVETLGERSEEQIAEFKAAMESQRLADDVDTLAAFKTTMATELMHVATTYIVTEPGETITSPPGFSPESRVFIQTRLAIMMNEEPTDANTPDTGYKQLSVFNVDEWVKGMA